MYETSINSYVSVSDCPSLRLAGITASGKMDSPFAQYNVVPVNSPSDGYGSIFNSPLTFSSNSPGSDSPSMTQSIIHNTPTSSNSPVTVTESLNEE